MTDKPIETLYLRAVHDDCAVFRPHWGPEDAEFRMALDLWIEHDRPVTVRARTDAQ